MEDPWGRLIRVGKFPHGMGSSLTELTVERVDTGSFEDDWSDVSTSNGTGASNGCNPDPSDLEFGQTLRSWNLKQKVYRTPCLCLDDLKTSFQINSQVSKTLTQLTVAQKRILGNRRRSEYMRMSDKMSCGNGGVNTTFASVTNGVFPVPQALLSQDLLDRLRLIKLRNGAGHNALGMEQGQPVLGLITSAETSRDLLRRNPDIRQDVRWAKPNELLAPLGVERSYGGFFHIIDMELPRWDFLASGGWTRRYPFISTTTDKGTKWEPNPLYDAAAFEGSFIFHTDVYEEAVQQIGPSIPDATFEDYPEYYTGQVFWNNFKSDNNPFGKKGRWLLAFQNGSRPIAPYFGTMIMHRRCPDDLSYQSCSAAYSY